MRIDRLHAEYMCEERERETETDKQTETEIEKETDSDKQFENRQTAC